MEFDKEYYDQLKGFSDELINHVNWMLAEKYQGKPVEWAKTFLPLIASCIHNEDYEGAKAMTDAIRDFLNKFLAEEDKISEDNTLKLPGFRQIKVQGIICFADGTAENINL